ncbi:MAG: hypothetical protein V6Z89_25435 [Desulfobacter sp.]
MRQLSIIIILFIAACASPSLDPIQIESEYSNVDVSDGVNEAEMKIIAQNYMLTNPDSLCEKEAQKIDLADPSIKCGWSDESDNGCYVGFSSSEVFSLNTLYIKVSSQSGKAWCAGYRIFK